MRPSVLLVLYARHLRAHLLREMLAGLGVAIGVALVFSVQAANHSIAGSAEQIIHALAGSAQLQVEARGPNGAPEPELLGLPGVKATASVLQADVTATAGGQTVQAQLLGAGVSAGQVNSIAAAVPLTGNGVLLPVSVARSLHVVRGGHVTLLADGRRISAPVQAVLGAETIGALAHSTIILAPLAYTQAFLGLPGRVTNTLVVGREPLARQSIEHAVGARMTVAPATAQDGLLRRALAPQAQSTNFFALVGALVGALLVVTAMLLTTADRRLMLIELRSEGYRPARLAQIVLSQAAMLGVASSTVGVFAGYLLATGVWRSNPAYLAGAFPLGTQTVVPIGLVLGVWLAGVALTCAAAAPVVLELRTSEGVSREGEPARLRAARSPIVLVAALVLVVVASVIPASMSLWAASLLMLALLLGVPGWWAGVVYVAGKFTRPRPLELASRSVRAAPVRSTALVATAAIGVFGAVVAQGAHTDLLHGLEGGYAQYVQSADMWITNTGDDLATRSIPSSTRASVSRVPGVQGVRAYYGGWMTVAGRKVWVIARSSPHAELPAGGVLAARRVRGGGWVALSTQLARDLHASVGGRVLLPTPSGPVTFRLAATTSNLGWSSGVVFLGAGDYTRYWGDVPSALEIQAPRAVLSAIRRRLPPGLRVQTGAQRASTADALPRQGLQRLAEIAFLLLIAAVLACAVTMSAAIWHSRSKLAAMRLLTFRPRHIQRVLAYEAALILTAGMTLGAGAGVYGHLLADRYLRVSTGYPVSFALGIPHVLGIVGLVLIAAVLVLAIPGYLAARVSPAFALDGS
jgi:putative ABC transport system permease protein